jgi:hypothetical protein
VLEVEMLLVCGDACVSDVHSGPVQKEKNSSGILCIFTLFSYCVSYPNLGAHATENGKRDARQRNDDLRDGTFLFSVICDRARLCANGGPPCSHGRTRMTSPTPAHVPQFEM